MWVVLFNALDDFGVKEINEVTRMNNSPATVPNFSQIDTTKRKVAYEALHGALRIAGLVSCVLILQSGSLTTTVLTGGSVDIKWLPGPFLYVFFPFLHRRPCLFVRCVQRLDPAVMLVSCIQSGSLLARLGRPEVSNCIAGLEQYSYSYEEAGEQAVEMRKVYNLVQSGEMELNHMASAASRLSPVPNAGNDAGVAMLVDEPDMDTTPLRSVRFVFRCFFLRSCAIDCHLQPNAFPASGDFALF